MCEFFVIIFILVFLVIFMMVAFRFFLKGSELYSKVKRVIFYFCGERICYVEYCLGLRGSWVFSFGRDRAGLEIC